MSNEANSALTFGDLILEVAYKIGVASYGSDGTEAPQIPTNGHDLTLCKRIVNKAIRKFIHDGPGPNGWHWSKPIAEVDLWPQISPDTTFTAGSPGSDNTYVTGVFVPATQRTTLTLHQESGGTIAFYPSMEYRQIWLDGQPEDNTPGFVVAPNETAASVGTAFTIVNYIDQNTIEIDGNALTDVTNLATGVSYSFASQGDYTLPANFGGEYAGEITYIANTNRGMILHWTDEGVIRSRRQNYNIESGTPFEAAVRLMPTPSLDILTTRPKRRRWELITWRIASEYLHVIFPYTLAFDELVNLSDSPPCPIGHDETLKACCLAVAEKEVTDAFGPDWQYYHESALPASYRIDAMSIPKGLGYFGNPSATSPKVPAIKTFRDVWYQRPTVSVGP